MLDLIRKLKADGRTVILISHNMRDVVALADRVVDPGHRAQIRRPPDRQTSPPTISPI